MSDEQRQSEKRQLVENAGLVFEQLGLPRMTGRVVGRLLMCGSPHQTAGQLAEALEVKLLPNESKAIKTTSRIVLARITQFVHKASNPRLPNMSRSSPVIKTVA